MQTYMYTNELESLKVTNSNGSDAIFIGAPCTRMVIEFLKMKNLTYENYTVRAKF